MLCDGFWAWARCDSSRLAHPKLVVSGGALAKAWVSADLERQEWRKAGLTEQRSLPTSNGGRITSCCTLSLTQTLEPH
jgi:hypothetical protein